MAGLPASADFRALSARLPAETGDRLADWTPVVVWSEAKALRADWTEREFRERSLSCLQDASSHFLLSFYEVLPEDVMGKLEGKSGPEHGPSSSRGLCVVEGLLLSAIAEELVPWLRGEADVLADRHKARRQAERPHPG